MADQTSKNSDKDQKKQRLAQQLRQNLKRRKGQTRASRSGKADQTNGLPLVDDKSRENKSD